MTKRKKTVQETIEKSEKNWMKIRRKRKKIEKQKIRELNDGKENSQQNKWQKKEETRCKSIKETWKNSKTLRT